MSTPLDDVERKVLRSPHILVRLAVMAGGHGVGHDGPARATLHDLLGMPESNGLESQVLALAKAIEEDVPGKVADLSLSLIAQLPDDTHWYVRYALALNGDRNAQRDLAVGYGDLAGVIAADVEMLSRRILTDEDRNLVERMKLAVEKCLALSSGWSAVSSGRRSKGRLTDATPYAHAHAIGSSTLALLWAGQQEKTYAVAYDTARRLYETKLRDATAVPATVLIDESLAELEALGADSDEEKIPPPALIVVPAGARGPERGSGVGHIAGAALPLIVADRDANPWADLRARFPHCLKIIDTFQAEVAPGRPVRLRPTLFLGEPGSGKSTLARAIFDALGIPFAIFDAATCADHAITGAPRRWSQSYPSLPISLCEQHEIANPGVLVDELEKAGRSSAGSIHDPLLSLLERRTAQRWRDQHLEAEVDVSHLSWLFTANSLAGLPMPLLSRLRVLRVSLPECQHVGVLARQLYDEILAERGTDPVFEPALDGLEIKALRQAFGPFGSLRMLRRYVEGVIDARSNPQAWN